MAEPIQPLMGRQESFKLLSLPKNAPSEMELFYSSSINSKIPDFRKKIRQALQVILLNKGFSDESTESVLDLSYRPVHKEVSISISHCQLATAILLGPKNFSLGVDLEEISRISTAIIERVAPHEEIDETPAPLLLFPSKEATWKAINEAYAVPTISNIRTKHWNDAGSNWKTFTVAIENQELPGKGYSSLLEATLTLSLFFQIN